MGDLYNYVNPKNGRHSPMISEEVNKIIQLNANVSFNTLFSTELKCTDNNGTVLF